MIKRFEIEDEEHWLSWCKEIPRIKFKEEWDVKVIPPFAGAMARFLVFKGDARVSVYLDVNDRLGCYGEPYWEVYPYKDDVQRCPMNDTPDLLWFIEESIKEQEQAKEEDERT